jgi:hypothetical protein
MRHETGKENVVRMDAGLHIMQGKVNGEEVDNREGSCGCEEIITDIVRTKTGRSDLIVQREGKYYKKRR